MRMLQRDFDVQTRYGGGFVQSINGIAGGRASGRAGRLVLLRQRRPGRRRRRRPQARRRRPGLVGPPRLGARRRTSAPSSARSPSRSCPASGGKKLPVRLDCADDADAACDEVADAARGRGRQGRRARRASPAPAARGCCASRSARWAEVRKDPAVRAAREGPGRVRRVRAAVDADGHLDRRCSTPTARRRARSAPATGSSRRPRCAARRRPGSSPAPTTAGVGAPPPRSSPRTRCAHHFAIAVRARPARAAARAAGARRRRDLPAPREPAARGARGGRRRRGASARGVVALSFEHPLVLGALLGVALLGRRGRAASAAASRSRCSSRSRSRWSSRSSTRSSSATGLTVVARLGDRAGARAARHDRARRLAYGGVLGLRALRRRRAASRCTPPRSIPTSCCARSGASRFRSALTAALATRLVPVLARDARRLHDAQRCRAGEPAPRRAVVRAVAAGALDRAVDVAATLEVRGYGAARASRRALRAAVVAPRPRVRRERRRARRRRRCSRTSPAGRSSAYPSSRRRSARGRARARARALVACVAAPVRRPPGDRAMSRAARSSASPTPTRARPRPRCATSTSTSRRASSSCSPGELGSGKSTLLRAACGLVPHFHGGEFAGRVEVGGLDTREHGPATLAAVAGTLFQDPETQVVMGTVRARARASRSRTAGSRRPRSRAGWRRRRSRSASRSCSTARRTSCPAASCSASRSAPRWPGRPRSRCSTSRPRSSTRSPATSCSACCGGSTRSGGRRSCWPSTGWSAASRAADRVIALARRRRRLRRRPRDVPRLGGRARARCSRPRARGCSRWPASARCPSPSRTPAARRSVQETRQAPSLQPAAVQERASAPSLAAPALRLDRVWFERKGGPAVLQGIDLEVAAGRARRADGAQRRREVDAAAARRRAARAHAREGRAAARVALVLQNPGDYALRDRVGDELPPATLEAAGLAQLADRHPRDISGGERQRLAIAIVLHGDAPRRALPGRADARHGPRPQGCARRALLERLSAQRDRDRRRDARRGVRRRARAAHGAARRRPPGGRRADRRGARRRLVLRDPDRAHPLRRARCCRRRARSLLRARSEAVPA